MKLPENLFGDVERSGRAGIEVSVQASGNIWAARQPDYWQFIFIRDGGGFDWIDAALAKVAQIATGQDRAYAELALRQASHVSAVEPRIKRAPEGGVLIEHRSGSDVLGLIVEGSIGLIVRTADKFRVSADFDLTAQSINELLARYVFELRLLYVSDSKRAGPWLSGFLTTP
jgi:hypothetical protein